MAGNPGLMNRRITIQERVVSKDATGGRVETWADAFKLWAQLLKDGGNEGTQAEAERSTQTRRFRVRYRSVLESGNYRVLYKLRFYDIESVEEEGVQDRMVLTCKSVKALTS